MMLDIDDSALNKKLQIIQDNSDENVIQWLQRDGNENHLKTKKIEPFPGLCIKTWSENGEKVFVNLCHSNEIPPPENVTDEQFLKMMTEDEPAFVIPMAIGSEKMSQDKSNVERLTYDILINTQFYERCLQKPYFLEFTINATLNAINDKYNQTVDIKKFVIMKNRKLMGSLDQFTIQDREIKKPKKQEMKKPLVQVIDIPEETKDKSINTNYASKYHPKINNSIIIETKNQDHLIGLFYLPLSLVKDIKVDIGENRIIVEDRKVDVMIDTFLPRCIDNDHVIAKFDSKLHILRLTLPLQR